MTIKNGIIEVLSNTWPIITLTCVVLIILRLISYKNNKNRDICGDIISLSFLVYILCLFQMVTLKDVNTIDGYNLIPFKEIFRYPFLSREFIRNVIGNILLFLPFGFYVGYYLKKSKLSLITIISFITSLTIELIQTKIGRTFDIDDIILNIIGGILGFLIYKVYDNLFINLSEKVKKIIMVLFLLLLGCGIIIIIV